LEITVKALIHSAKFQNVPAGGTYGNHLAYENLLTSCSVREKEKEIWQRYNRTRKQGSHEKETESKIKTPTQRPKCIELSATLPTAVPEGIMG
jgi:hypothetical protein